MGDDCQLHFQWISVDGIVVCDIVQYLREARCLAEVAVIKASDIGFLLDIG